MAIGKTTSRAKIDAMGRTGHWLPPTLFTAVLALLGLFARADARVE